MHPHLEVALNRSGIFWGGKKLAKFFVVGFCFFNCIVCETEMFGCWQQQLWCGSTETTLPGRWDRSSEPVGGDDSAGNTLQLQGNKTEWKQWRHVYAEERNALQTFPALALHLLVSWYEVVQFRGLSWLQWRGIRGESWWGFACLWWGTAPWSCSVGEMCMALALPSPLLSPMNFYLLPLHWLLAELWGKTQGEENVAAKTFYADI